MPLVVIVATEPVGSFDRGLDATGSMPTARLPFGGGAVLGRLLDQLASLDGADARVVTRPEFAPELRKDADNVIESDGPAGDLREIARAARAAPGELLVMHGDVVAHREMLLRLLSDTRTAASAVLARPGSHDPPTRPVVRVAGGHIVSAGSSYHRVADPNAVFRGVLRVGAKQTSPLAELAERLAVLVETPGELTRTSPVRRVGRAGSERTGDADLDDPGEETLAGLRALGGTPVTGDDAPTLILVGLVRSGVRVAGHGTGALVCERVLDQTQADAAVPAVGAVDEDRVRLARSVKSNDGFFTTVAVSSYSSRIVTWAARLRLSPNAVTCVSMGVAVLAAVGFAWGDRVGMVLGGVLLYLSFVLDCVDGQLARYTRRFSVLGAWLDATFDRAKEYVAYAGLAVGATAAAPSGSVYAGDVWGLAVAAMTLQTCRHMVAFGYGVSSRRPPERSPVSSLAVPDDGPGSVDLAATRPKRGGAGGLLGRLSGLSARVPVLYWAKRIIVLPIGERFALIAITAAVFNARVTLLAVLVWGGIAAAYTMAGRLLRSLGQRKASP